ncbi:MAG: hypothetical protein RQ866_03075 [Bacteroidales bacterium]|nr:hypothetical protein [Bacteroidales bacterium]
MKKLLVLFIAIASIAACGNKNESNEEKPLKVGEFIEVAADYVDSVVVVEGLAEHMCAHSKRKIHFVCPADHDLSIKLFAAKDSADFDPDLQGKILIVTGIVQEERLTKEEVDQMEKELIAETDEEGDAEIDAETEESEEHIDDVETAVDQHHMSKAGYIKEYRATMAESGLDYIPFYSIIVQKIVVKETEEPAEEEK